LSVADVLSNVPTVPAQCRAKVTAIKAARQGPEIARPDTERQTK
jgi:hypothetical protein